MSICEIYDIYLYTLYTLLWIYNKRVTFRGGRELMRGIGGGLGRVAGANMSETQGQTCRKCHNKTQC